MVLRAALLQLCPAPAAPEVNLAAIGQAARAAAAMGAAFLATPEMGLTGYAIGADIPHLAEARDGPLVAQVAALAAETGVAILAGFPERDGGQIFNTVVFACPDGQRFFYRKCHLYGPDERAAFTPSDTLPAVFTFAGVRFGLLICYDVEFPEMVRGLTGRGAEVVVVATAIADTPSCRAIAEAVIPARALENHVFVLYADLCGRERGLSYHGGSVIAAPDGAVLAKAGAGPGLLVVDLDLTGYDAARSETPYAEDRRPALYGDD